MSHNIQNNSEFLSYREPAWHKLGMVIDEQIGAVEAGRRLHLPEIMTEPLFTVSGLPTDSKAIIGAVDGAKTVYAVVSKGYHEISHKDFLQAWDGALPESYVETIGLLGAGETLFLSTKLPGFSVNGDELITYLMAYNPLTGREATTVRITPVRVVCYNTLIMSGSQYVEQHRVVHNQPAAAQIATFLKDAFAKTVAKVETVREAYALLASFRLTDEQAKGSFKAVYPDLAQPVGVMGRATFDKDALDQMAAWERRNGAQMEHRTGCYNLYQGDGRGSMSEAAKGTAWGAYNAVVEYEQHLKRFRKAEFVMFGAGANRVAEAFDSYMALASKG